MLSLPYSSNYERWAPVLGRILLAVPFLVGAFFKIPGTEGFAAEAGMTAAVGVPFATAAVFLAFLLEVLVGIAFIIGWKVRMFAAILIPYVILLTALFHHSFTTPYDIGFFVDHLVLIGALLYASVYGARYAAVTPD
ncbi:MAG TPA: DoxX family protein [Candidatus Paceibacterota bacterium]|nr:DoxX family protein [Candidatus Paceibacterota bacterium]